MIKLCVVRIICNTQVLVSKQNLKMHCFYPVLKEGKLTVASIFVLIADYLFYLHLINEYRTLASDSIMPYASLYLEI